MVGDTRIELVTSSVSGKRSSSELITHRVTATKEILPFRSFPVKYKIMDISNARAYDTGK